MLRSNLSSLALQVVKPINLLRLGLVCFMLTVLFLRFPMAAKQTVVPITAQANGICGGNGCEAAGHCWPGGTVGGNGDNGCKYVCDGSNWGQQNCNTTQAEKDQYAALKNQYEQQVAAANAANGSGGGGGTTAAQNAAATTCAAGSASGCVGRPFYSAPSNAPTMLCFPNGVTSTGLPVCGRDSASKVGTTVNPVTGKAEGGYILTANGTNTTDGAGNVVSTRATSPSTGGCSAVVVCGCSTGQQSLCVNNIGGIGSSVADYCAKNVCSPIGTNGKVCTPGQVSECIAGTTKGKFCNLDGKGWTEVHAHACGATHTVAYCAQSSSGGTSVTGTQCNGVTFNTAEECEKKLGASSCVRGVAKISQAAQGVESKCADACDSAACKDKCVQSVNNKLACINTGKTEAQCAGLNVGGLPVGAANAVSSIVQSTISGKCPSTGSFSSFVGCGTGAQAKYNCYQTCKNGVESRVCLNEPGLSCGAHEGNKIAQTAAAVATRFEASKPTVVTSPPPTNAPSPQPTPTPTATCGEPCGNGIICTGSNQACVSGTCRSTLCAVSEQDAQCVCKPPSPPPMACIDIFASKTDIKIGDQVSFTCAQVPNAVRYEFRYAYVKAKTGIAGAVMGALNPSSATSRTSESITIDKVGRYVAQCRPCAANNLCTEWEPLDGQIGGPKLEPAGGGTTTASPTPTTSTNATQSAQM